MKAARWISLLLTALTLATLFSCKSVADKAGEQLAASLLEKATGNKVDVDTSKGQLTVKGEDGSSFTVGGSEWPADKMGPLPKPKCTIIAAVTADTGASVTFEDMESNDAKAYYEEIVALKLENEYKLASDGGYLVSGEKDGYTVGFSYAKNKSGLISCGKKAK